MGDIWEPVKIPKAHEEVCVIFIQKNKQTIKGCNAISWAPAKRLKSILDATDQIEPKRMVSGGNDRLVKIWRFGFYLTINNILNIVC